MEERSDLPVVGSGSLVSTYVPKLPAITQDDLTEIDDPIDIEIVEPTE